MLYGLFHSFIRRLLICLYHFFVSTSSASLLLDYWRNDGWLNHSLLKTEKVAFLSMWISKLERFFPHCLVGMLSIRKFRDIFEIHAHQTLSTNLIFTFGNLQTVSSARHRTMKWPANRTSQNCFANFQRMNDKLSTIKHTLGVRQHQ